MATVVTKTVKPAGGGDYTTLAAALTANAGNLVSLDRVLRLECHAGDVGAASPNGYTTDATRYVLVEFLSGSSSTGNIYAANIANMVIRGGAIDSGGNWSAVVGHTGGGTIVECAKIIGAISGNTKLVSQNVRLRNCVLYNKYTSPDAYGVYQCNEVVNCTVIGFARNITGLNTVCINTISDGFLSSAFDGTYDASSSNNVSSTLSANFPGSNPIRGTVAFVNAAARDYHLAAGDTVARGAGVNLTASGITTDIDGETRPSSGAWDVGADQVIASGGITMRQVSLQSVALSQPQLRAISA